MITFDTPYRVCYGDTDRMGVMYYGNYPRLYEIGRTDLIRHFWKSYRDVEEQDQIVLPVRKMLANYYKPAFYDDLITIRTTIKELPMVKLRIHSQIYNAAGELINEGEVTLGFMDKQTGKPRHAPEEFIDKLRSHLS